MRPGIKNLFSRWRFELLGLTIALVFAGTHWWSDTSAVGGPGIEADSIPRSVLRAIHILEGKTTDLQFRLRGPRQPHPDVVVIAIDEQTAQTEGLWPWPRDRVAALFDALHASAPAAVGFDGMFTDEVSNAAQRDLRELLFRFDQDFKEGGVQLAEFRQLLVQKSAASPDARLAEAFANAPELVQGCAVYGAKQRSIFAAREKINAELLEPHVIKQVSGRPGELLGDVPLASFRAWDWVSAEAPLPVFAKASKRIGFFNTQIDPDGTIRRTPLFARLEQPQGLLSHLVLQTAATYWKGRVEAVFNRDGGYLEGARIVRAGPPVFIPLETTEPFTLVNHVGPRASFLTYSAADVLAGTVGRAELAGKALLVGVTLVGSFDQRVTPFAEIEPGVYVNASLLSNVLSGRTNAPPCALVPAKGGRHRRSPLGDIRGRTASGTDAASAGPSGHRTSGR